MDRPLRRPFDERLGRRMCQRGALLYANQGGSGRGLAQRLCVRFDRFAQQATRVLLYDGVRDSSPAPLPVPRAAQAAAIFIYYRLVRILVGLFFQYTHDICLLKLRRLAWLAADARPAQVAALVASQSFASGSPLEAPEVALLERFAWSRRWLELLGAPGRDFTLMVELVGLTELWIIMLGYLCPYMTHRWLQPYQMDVIRMLDDSDRERANYTRLTLLELQQLASSSRRLAVAQQANSGSQTNFHTPTSRLNRLQRLQTHRLTTSRLRRLALAGHFEPPNRQGPLMAHFRTLRLYTILIWPIGFLIPFSLFSLYLPHFQLLTSVAPVYHQTWADVASHLEYICVCWLILITSCCHLSAAGLMLLDRLWLAAHLEAAVDRCLASGRLLMENELKLVDLRPLERFRDQLVTVLVQHRIALQHQRAGRRTLSSMCLTMVEALLAGPLAALLHGPFFDARIAHYMTCSYLMVFGAVDLCLVLVCQLNGRACRLYRAMTRLAALLTQLQACREPLAACSEPHLDALLRAQLSQPQLIVDQMSIPVLGLVFNYKRFVRLHFWAGLWLFVATMASLSAKTGAPVAGDSMAHKVLSVFI